MKRAGNFLRAPTNYSIDQGVDMILRYLSASQDRSGSSSANTAIVSKLKEDLGDTVFKELMSCKDLDSLQSKLESKYGKIK